MHHALHVIEILLGLERVVDAVIASFVKFFVAQVGIVAEMRAPGRFDQSMRHQSAGRDNGIHDAAIDQLGDDQALLGTVMAPASVITMKASLSRAMASSTSAASPSWRPVNAVLDIARTRSSIGVNLLEIERLERNQAVRYRIVQLALDSRAFVVLAFMMTMLCDTFMLQGKPPE